MPRSSKKTTKKVTKKVAKKATKKTTKKATKKTTKKNASKQTNTSGRVLVCANGEHCFWLHDGQILDDLNALAAALRSMSEEVFSHHVSAQRNDFAEWVEHVLCDADCAHDLRSRRSPRGAYTVVTKHLRLYA